MQSLVVHACTVTGSGDIFHIPKFAKLLLRNYLLADAPLNCLSSDMLWVFWEEVKQLKVSLSNCHVFPFWHLSSFLMSFLGKSFILTTSKTIMKEVAG